MFGDDANPDCLAGGNQAWPSLGAPIQSLQWEGGESLACGARPRQKGTSRQTAVGTQRPGKVTSFTIFKKVVYWTFDPTARAISND